MTDLAKQAAGEWWRRWRKTALLPKGTVLYHGTSQGFPPSELTFPAWFSTAQAVAEHFQGWHGSEGGETRVLRYQLTSPLRLPRIDSKEDMDRLAEMYGEGLRWGAEDIIDAIAETNLPGWIIPHNYPEGDDILIADGANVQALDPDPEPAEEEEEEPEEGIEQEIEAQRTSPGEWVVDPATGNTVYKWKEPRQAALNVREQEDAETADPEAKQGAASSVSQRLVQRLNRERYALMETLYPRGGRVPLDDADAGARYRRILTRATAFINAACALEPDSGSTAQAREFLAKAESEFRMGREREADWNLETAMEYAHQNVHMHEPKTAAAQEADEWWFASQFRFPLTVYRELRLPRGEGLAALRKEGLGVYWTTKTLEKETFWPLPPAHWPPGPEPWVLRAVVPGPEFVDWKSTMRQRRDRLFGPEEEITVRRGAPLESVEARKWPDGEWAPLGAKTAAFDPVPAPRRTRALQEAEEAMALHDEIKEGAESAWRGDLRDRRAYAYLRKRLPALMEAVKRVMDALVKAEPDLGEKAQEILDTDGLLSMGEEAAGRGDWQEAHVALNGILSDLHQGLELAVAYARPAGSWRTAARGLLTRSNPKILKPYQKGLVTVKTPKMEKSTEHGYLTGILHLAPAEASGYGNVCPCSTPECRAVCLNTSGRGRFTRTQDARTFRTKLYFTDRKSFLENLRLSIDALVRAARRKDLKPAVRLNGTSDLPNLSMMMAREYPEVQFYDYTKIPKPWTRTLPNYDITFSRSESNEKDTLEALDHGISVAVVFDVGGRKSAPLPARWMGYPVIDGDRHDLRFLDRLEGEGPFVVGLRAKGKAVHKGENEGFVVKLPEGRGKRPKSAMLSRRVPLPDIERFEEGMFAD